ncbi:RING finger protein 215 isoform X2 [Phycodurus eques]|uniref:RING finger protein 215 isoform X2 n=1 Tax=Phycodurus eques TaxID=693459 RepID=UPI002ACD2D4C|nr:RING finger protein 215 isoform X2 [Phycodurus eques]
MASPLLVLLWSGLVLPFAAAAPARPRVAVVEVYAQQRLSGTLLRGEVVTASRVKSNEGPDDEPESLEGELVLIKDSEPQVSGDDKEEGEIWIGVMPVEDHQVSAGSRQQESFTEAVVSRMKRALVLGASALIILALNQNTVREMDLSPVLSKPVIVIQTSENVTRLLGALLRGLHATAKITFGNILPDNLGATLTLWSSCGRSRGGRYGEWQGVICTGETNSQVQKYLQRLWDTVLWVALFLSTGVILQARWQNHDRQINGNMEDVQRTISSLRTKTYRRPKVRRDETDNCAVCLEAFNHNQCLRVLPCRHEYHQDCVDPWLLLHHTCPLCKRSILVWFEAATKKDKLRLQQIACTPLPTLEDFYAPRTKTRACKILLDPPHPGHHLFQLVPSGRHYRSMPTKTSRHSNSFFPLAIDILNS